MTMLDFNQTKFLKSASRVTELPQDDVPEVAFVGRSNAGKSSALNTLTKQKKLARTSKTPGRTQLLNCFQINDCAHIIDLPGYGFANVSKSQQSNWEKMMTQYLYERKQLEGIVIVMDCRHPLTSLDLNMLGWCKDQKIPTHLLLTKADKFSRSQQNQTLFNIQKHPVLIEMHNVTLQLFSSSNGLGLDTLANQLSLWLNQSNN